MLKNIFSGPGKSGARHWSFSELSEAFERAYASMGLAVTLCQGLEIVAANAAAKKLLHPVLRTPCGALLNTLFDDQSKIDVLFTEDEWPVSVNVGKSQISVIARPWAEQRDFWLLEWNDLTQLMDVTDQLHKARIHDTATGTLLPEAFARSAGYRLQEWENAVLGMVALPAMHYDDMQDTIFYLAEQLRAEFGQSAIIGRHDSATLAILMASQEDEREALHIMRQLNRISAQVLPSHNATVALAAYPRDADAFKTLSHNVQLTLEIAREKGEATLFTSAIIDAENRRRALAEDMPKAIASNEITPFFQPIIHATSGHIKGFEALIRWFHPELGFVIPPDIIDIAQENDLLHELTAHVMRIAIALMAEWPDNIQFAVNVTPSQLTDEMVDLVRELVREAEIDPKRLEIEVTEDALIEDFEYSAKIFARLRAIGVAVAMDDFGSGYTSVGNLRILDFTKIKIDKIITDGLPHDAKSFSIMKSLIYMANELEVDVTVEGIETQEQLDMLRPFDCGIQGYVFAKPMPVAELPTMKKHLAPAEFPARNLTLIEKSQETVERSPKTHIRMSNA